MTGAIKDAMERQARDLAAPRLDLDSITGEGDRRVRRRRFGAAAAGVAGVLAATAVAFPFVVDDPVRSVDEGQVAVGTAPSLSYAIGSVIHHDGRTTDVGHKVFSFVATDAGFVSVDPAGRVWSTVGTESTQVGQGVGKTGRTLVADGSWAGWVEHSGDAAPKFRFLDQASGETFFYSEGEAAGDAGGYALRALDGETAYFETPRGTFRIDVRAAKPPVELSTDPKVEISDVEDGVILFEVTGGQGFVKTYAAKDLDTREDPLANEGGDLSPGAGAVMSENSSTSSDDFTLRALPGGADLAPEQEADYGFFLGYAWVDDDAYTAFGIASVADEGEMTIDLLTCSAADRSCEVAERDLDWNDLEFPIGEHVGE